MWLQVGFLLTLQIMGADRIMYSVDYPYVISEQARTFLENAPISPADKQKIAHGNAEKVLKISLKWSAVNFEIGLPINDKCQKIAIS